MGLKDVYVNLLTETQKRELIEQELEFLIKAVEVRNTLIEKMQKVADKTTNVKQLAEAIEILTKEIRKAEKRIEQFMPHQSGEVVDDEILEMQQKLEEIRSAIQ